MGRMSEERFEFVDKTDIDENFHRLLHRIKVLSRECENENINFEEYIDLNSLKIVIRQLECCLKHKETIQRLEEYE